MKRKFTALFLTLCLLVQKLFSDGEIDKDSVIRKFRITASDGKDYGRKNCG